MNIIRPIIAGILIGAALFFMPFFLVRFFLFFLVIGAIVRFVIGRRFSGSYRRGFNAAFTDNIRNMSEEEYSRFKQNFSRSCGFNQYQPVQPKTNPE